MKKEVIGVTGSLSTGKTTVCAILRRLGAAVIDADKIVHALYKNDPNVKAAVRKKFGNAVFTGGRIDRKKLARLAFGKKKVLKAVTGIIHPKVIKEIKKGIKKRKNGIVVIEAPLLFETGLEKVVDYVIVVKCSKKNQIKRSRAKGLKKAALLSRVKAQMPLGEKIKRADFVIDNNFSKKYTRKKVERIWQNLKRR